MKCLVIDDNIIARTTIRHLAGQVSGLTVVGECSNGMEAFNLLRREKVDLLLLDIEMPGMTGLELTKNLGVQCPAIIFTTSKKEYAVEAFELNVVDYLVKPITPARFIQAIGRAMEWKNEPSSSEAERDKGFLFIRDAGVIKRINIDDILFAEAMGDYVKIHTAERYYLAHSTLKALEERLPVADFLRIHRSYLVALHQIDMLREGTVLIREHQLPVSDSCRSLLSGRLNIL
jgi:two-component system, LytTR family, response regulator